MVRHEEPSGAVGIGWSSIFRGRRFGVVMRNVAKLLERKRTLLDRRQQAGPEHLAEVEHELHEIDEVLSRLESMDAPPTAPQHPDRP